MPKSHQILSIIAQESNSKVSFETQGKFSCGPIKVRKIQAPWCTPAIPTLGKPRQMDHLSEFKDSMCYIVTSGSAELCSSETLSQKK